MRSRLGNKGVSASERICERREGLRAGREKRIPARRIGVPIPAASWWLRQQESPPVVLGHPVKSLDGKIPGRGAAASPCSAWEIPWTRRAWWAAAHGWKKRGGASQGAHTCSLGAGSLSRSSHPDHNPKTAWRQGTEAPSGSENAGTDNSCTKPFPQYMGFDLAGDGDVGRLTQGLINCT